MLSFLSNSMFEKFLNFIHPYLILRILKYYEILRFAQNDIDYSVIVRRRSRRINLVFVIFQRFHIDRSGSSNLLNNTNFSLIFNHLDKTFISLYPASTFNFVFC